MALLLCAVALALVAIRGHLALAVVLALPATLRLAHCWRDTLNELELRCHQGGWHFGRQGQLQPAALLHSSTTLPWLVFVRLRPTRGGTVQRLWLFRDALGTEDYRRLRARLTVVPAASG